MRFDRTGCRSNPWPQGMAIRVDETPHQLTILLFIRHAWGIAADVDVPRLDPLPDVGFSRIPETAAPAEWDARWHRAWKRAWDWYSVEEPDPTIHPTPEYIRARLAAGSWPRSLDSAVLAGGPWLGRDRRRRLHSWEWLLQPAGLCASAPASPTRPRARSRAGPDRRLAETGLDTVMSCRTRATSPADHRPAPAVSRRPATNRRATQGLDDGGPRTAAGTRDAAGQGGNGTGPGGSASRCGEAPAARPSRPGLKRPALTG